MRWEVGQHNVISHTQTEDGLEVEGVKQMVELVSIRPISHLKKKTAWKWKGGVDGGLDGSECMDGLDVEG